MALFPGGLTDLTLLPEGEEPEGLATAIQTARERASHREALYPCVHDKLGLKRLTECLASEKERSIINRKGNIIVLLDRIDFVSFILSICLLQPRKYTETQLISFLSQDVSAERPYLQVIQDSAFLEQTVDGRPFSCTGEPLFPILNPPDSQKSLPAALGREQGREV